MPANEYLKTWKNQQREALNFPHPPPRHQPSHETLTEHGVPPAFASFLTDIAYPSGGHLELTPNGGVLTTTSDDDLDSMLSDTLDRVLSYRGSRLANDAFQYVLRWNKLKESTNDIAIGSLFLGHMNAGIVSPLAREAIIVIDPDFLKLLHCMSRILVGGIDGHKDEHGFFIYEGWKRTKVFGHKLSIEQAFAFARECSEWFRTGGSRQSFDRTRPSVRFGGAGPRLHDLGWLIDGQASSLFRAMLEFIVAHEIAHLVLGHLDTSCVNRMMFPGVEVTDVRALQESSDDEYQADRCATELFMVNGSAEAFCEGAPDVLFLIYELFGKLGVVMNSTYDHPPPRKRLEQIRRSPFDRIRPEALSFVASVKDTFDRFLRLCDGTH